MTFRVGFVTGATPDKWARAWRERERERLELVPVFEEVQLDELRTGSLSMALVRLPVERDGLHLIPLYEELPVVVMGIEHDATVVDEVTMGDLAEEEFVDWRRFGISDAVSMVASGAGVLQVPMSVARLHARKDVTYRPVTDLPATTVGLAWRMDDEDPRIQRFVGIVRGRTARSSRD
ncbi:LysR substrate-binding domain-containing protein [Nocardioides sp.]|uniref:LysR substrate-binding domain-containing protein n=1 Tax=Nocardioides sp. TaxID=35761 RepID=UPI00356A540C